MSVRGEDILKALQQMMQDDANIRQFAQRQAYQYARPQYERGIHGEPIKPITEAEIVGSEINKLEAPAPSPAPPKDKS